MIKFLLKGLIRDRHRSLFPILSISIGVTLTVLLQSWITGYLGDIIDYNARFSTGHVKVITKAKYDNSQQMANDLAIVGTNKLQKTWTKNFPKLLG